MDKKVWFAVRIRAAVDAAEAVEFALNSLEALGTEVIDFPNQDRSFVTVTGYFDVLPCDVQFLGELEDSFRIHERSMDQIASVTTEEIENTDWLAEWKRHWKPTIAGGFIIAAPWHEVDHSEGIVIRIEPSMAFGTGTHETTKLCLGVIGKNLRQSESFLDVGTGTGILAIAAAKSFASSRADFLGIDNDPDSIMIARENAELNDVGDRIAFEIATLSYDIPHFDFVCANLTLDVILPILSLLIEKTDRILVLSGILAEQEEHVIEGLGKSDLVETEISCDGEWIAVTIRKT